MAVAMTSSRMPSSLSQLLKDDPMSFSHEPPPFRLSAKSNVFGLLDDSIVFVLLAAI
jgi:hypothetical protein